MPPEVQTDIPAWWTYSGQQPPAPGVYYPGVEGWFAADVLNNTVSYYATESPSAWLP